MMAVIQNIAAIRLSTLHECFGWIMEGLGLALPEKIREFRFRPHEYIANVDENGNIRSWHLRETSLFGVSRLTAIEPPTPSSDLSVTLCLPETQILETVLSLPKAVRGNLQEAVALRLREVSPIPTDQVSWTSRISEQNVETGSDSRLRIAVCIARKDHIDTVRDAVPVGVTVPSVGFMSRHGETGYFERQERSVKPGRILPVVTLLAAIVFLLTGVQSFTARQLSVLEEYRQALIEDGKTLKRETDHYQEILAAMGRPGAVSVRELVSGLQSIENDLLPKASVTRIELADRKLKVAGQTTSETTPSQEDTVLTPVAAGTVTIAVTPFEFERTLGVEVSP